jgi:hypothetical protein
MAAPLKCDHLKSLIFQQIGNLRLWFHLKSYYCILRWIKRIGGLFSLKQKINKFKKKLEWGIPTLENAEIVGKTRFSRKILIHDPYLGQYDFFVPGNTSGQ